MLLENDNKGSIFYQSFVSAKLNHSLNGSYDSTPAPGVIYYAGISNQEFPY